MLLTTKSVKTRRGPHSKFLWRSVYLCFWGHFQFQSWSEGNINAEEMGHINSVVFSIGFGLLWCLSLFLSCCCRRLQEKTEDAESTQNNTMRNTRRNAVIQLEDAIIPEIKCEEPHAYPSNSFRMSMTRNFQQSLSVSLPPEIILTPSQHVISQECDRPPSYESLFPK